MGFPALFYMAAICEERHLAARAAALQARSLFFDRSSQFDEKENFRQLVTLVRCSDGIRVDSMPSGFFNLSLILLLWICHLTCILALHSLFALHV